MFLEKARGLWATVRGSTGDDAGTGFARDATAGERAEGSSAERDSTPESKLFRCPECDVVYLALEKETCSGCRNEVTEVTGSPTDD